MREANFAKVEQWNAALGRDDTLRGGMWGADGDYIQLRVSHLDGLLAKLNLTTE